MKLFIIGYMGAGKTRFGEALAGLLNYSFIDLDQVIESHFHLSISDFFEKYGEEVFRDVERKALQENEFPENCVISTGGGTPCFFNNMDFMLNTGKCIYLKQDTRLIKSRLTGMRKKRPLLKDVPEDELENHIIRHLREREKFYLRSDLVLEGEITAEEAAERIRSLFPDE